MSLSIKAQIMPLNLLSDTTVICSGDSVLVKFNTEQISKNASYYWQTPNSIIIHAKQMYLKYKGLYIVKITDNRKVFIDTTFVVLNEKPKVSKIRDTTICNNPIIITIQKKEYKYQWSNGEKDNNIIIEKPGIYWLKTINKGCAFTDTFKVNGASNSVPNFGKEILICENDPPKVLSVKASSDVKLFWNTGSNSSSISVSKEGVYWVKSISKICGTQTDSVTIKYKNCDCDMFIPNSFTPNDDDKNDYFSPSFQCEYSYFTLTIFDRWGNTVYSSTNINGKWDGKFKGNPCPDDVYVYKLEAIQKNNDKKTTKSGHISLFR